MRIPKEATISACENALAILSTLNSPQPLQIPTKLKYASAGGEISWAQFLVTYAQKFGTKARLHTYARSATDIQIETFCDRLYGLIASLGIYDIFGIDKRTGLTDNYRSIALKRLEGLQSHDPYSVTKGASIEVIAADHINRPCPHLLYKKELGTGFKMRSRQEFVDLAAYLIHKTDPVGKIRYKVLTVRALGNILYEIFKNTEDHALWDIDGNRLSVSFRLFQFSVISPDKNALDALSEHFTPFEAYFDRHQPLVNRRHIPFLVLSILDSGPGFAQHWTRATLDSLSIDQEQQAVINCFGYNTTKHHDRFGQGLPLVRSLLRQQDGFLRLRTGRLSLYYDASRDSDSGTDDMPLHAWRPGNGSALAPVAGSLLTILFPIGRDQ